MRRGWDLMSPLTCLWLSLLNKPHPPKEGCVFQWCAAGAKVPAAARVEQWNPQHYCLRPDHVQPELKKNFFLLFLNIYVFEQSLWWQIHQHQEIPHVSAWWFKFQMLPAPRGELLSSFSHFLLILFLQICGVKPRNKDAKSHKLYLIINHCLLHGRALVLWLWNTFQILLSMTWFELDCRPSGFLTYHNVAVVAKTYIEIVGFAQFLQVLRPHAVTSMFCTVMYHNVSFIKYE